MSDVCEEGSCVLCAGVQLQSVYQCLESADEMETTETENNYQVSCFIAQGASPEMSSLLL